MRSLKPATGTFDRKYPIHMNSFGDTFEFLEPKVF